VGAAIKDFSKVLSIKVPRSRYLPVKSTSDLFLIQSNLYSVSRGMMIMNPKRCVELHSHPSRRGPLGDVMVRRVSVCLCGISAGLARRRR
jgi:UTP--glucose-1-phosphate uridylyltransferase